VLLAGDAPVGVVIRRGPSKSVCTLLWNRQRDTFRLGQWLRGRIYERRSDLSPDGRHMIYFAMNGRWHTAARGAWTAISRAPWLKAIALFSKGDCWNGGGLFTAANSYWLNDGYGHVTMRDSSEVVRDMKFQPPALGNSECLGVYYPRLIRDGWTFAEHTRKRSPSKSSGPDTIDTFEKPATHGWILRKFAHAGIDQPEGKGCYWDEHELFQPETGARIALPDWEWADIDGKRLVWATGGLLKASRLNSRGLKHEVILADLTDMKFEAIAAPY